MVFERSWRYMDYDLLPLFKQFVFIQFGTFFCRSFPHCPNARKETLVSSRSRFVAALRDRTDVFQCVTRKKRPRLPVSANISPRLIFGKCTVHRSHDSSVV
jgi:hypothetical protein